MGLGTKISKPGTGISVLLVAIFVLLAVVASIFSSYYFTSTITEQRAQELEILFSQSSSGFQETAENILNTRGDIYYIKLLDSDGILQESFGTEDGDNIEIIPLTTSANTTILVGINGTDFRSLTISSAIWSALIGLLISIITLFLLSFLSNGNSDTVEKLIAGMKRVSRGDLSSKLESSDAGDDVTMIRAFETYNQMLDLLKRKEQTAPPEEPVFQPTLIEPEGVEDDEEEEIETEPTSTTTTFDQSKYKQKNPLPIILISIIVLLVIGGGAYYFFSYLPAKQKEKEAKELALKKQKEEAERKKREEQERQRKAEEEARLAAQQEAEPEEGTIETVPDKTGRSYVVVASFFDDDFANDYAKELSAEGVSTKILVPPGGKGFYRVAIADYETYNEAMAAVSDFSSTYGDQVWALRF